MLREILAKIEFGQRRFETRHVLDHRYGLNLKMWGCNGPYL